MCPTPPSPSAGTYVYCIVQAEPFGDGSPPIRARAIGERGDAVRTIPFRDLAVVASDAQATRYDIARERLLAHQLVIEEAMTRSEVLPVRFSTVAKSDEEVVEKLLRRRSEEMHRLFRYVGGRVELGLKVFWRRERLYAEIVAESARIRALRDVIGGRPPDETRHQLVQLGMLTEEAVLRKRRQEEAAFVDALMPLACETKLGKVLNEVMVLNAAFLVDRMQEPTFDAAVSAAEAAQSGRFIFWYVGPVPPYNFVNVVVHFGED